MDKKLYPNLDPKLKEVYDRVMGFKLPPAPTHTPNPVTPTVTKTVSSPSIAYSPQSTPKPIPGKVPFITNSNISSAKKSNSVSSIVVIVVAAIFFLVYAFFWVKFFNIQLPFSLPFLTQ